jgi:hypothetical protein
VYISVSGQVIRVDAVSGTQTTVGTGFNSPYSGCFDSSGNLYIADWSNLVVKLVPDTPFVAPEYEYGALFGLLACIAAFAAFAIKKRPSKLAGYSAVGNCCHN